MNTAFDPLAFARSSADIAFDSGVSEFGGLEQAIDSYRDNVRDTCAEHGQDCGDALDAFERRVTELRAKSTDRAAHRAIEQAWKDRAKAQQLKPGTKTYARAEIEFFAGAMAAINAFFPDADSRRLSSKVPPIWVINAISGRPIAE